MHKSVKRRLLLLLFSVAEKDALVTSLQEELREVKEKMSADDVCFYSVQMF